MAKKFDDVIMPEGGRRKSIRDIPIPESRKAIPRRSTDNINLIKKTSPLSTPQTIERFAQTPPPPPVNPVNTYSSNIPPVPPPRTYPSRSRSSKKNVLIAGIVGILILAFAALTFFDGATLVYTPKTQSLEFANDTFTAKKTSDSGLLFSIVKLSGEKGEGVSASGETQVSRKASGVIVVYNEGSDQQKLIENTRFQSAAGKVYRINKAIIVPAKSGATPGSVEATVYADAPGVDFNTDPTDFTLPGLQGTPKFKTVYARSKGSITGGFVGTEKSVSDDDLVKTKTDLRATLTTELIQKAQAEVPPDFILFPALTSITFDDEPQTPGASSDKVNVNIKGNLAGIMFKRADLAAALAKNKAALKDTEVVDMPKIDTLNVSFAGTPPTDLLSLTDLSFKVSGSANLVWRTDEVALKSDLLGRNKSDLDSVLRNYPTIASASATIRPFWKRSLPKSPNKITIKKVQTE